MIAGEIPEHRVIWSDSLHLAGAEAGIRHAAFDPYDATPRPVSERGVCIFASWKSAAEEV